jgi:hypothetical protein
MISWRTKALLFLASLPLLVCVGLVAWLELLPYYDRLMGNNSRFIRMFSFHFTPWAWIWVVTLVAGLMSLLYDKRTIRKP